MTDHSNALGTVASADESESTSVPELGVPDAETNAGDGPDPCRKLNRRRNSNEDLESVAARLRERGERVRRRELETALQRLEARGAVSPEERRVLDRLAARITAGLVERWTARLADDGVDPAIALELLEDGE